MLTPASWAILLVLALSKPSLTRMRAVASIRASTVARDRSCDACFLGFVSGLRAMPGVPDARAGMRVDNVSDSSHFHDMHCHLISMTKGTAMFTLPYRTLIHYKRWATD